HVVIDVVICDTGGGETKRKPQQVVRETCQSWGGGCAVCLARAASAPRPGEPLPDGCSPRACRKCFWYGFAGCSATPSVRGRCLGHSSRFRAVEARQAHVPRVARPVTGRPGDQEI